MLFIYIIYNYTDEVESYILSHSYESCYKKIRQNEGIY